MVILIKILQVVLALSILVLVHEFGHFLFARIFKIRVEKFYLFFDAGFRLFKFKPKNSDTEYGIGWLPLGGYCKISGMIDESMDKDAIKQEPQPWEFRTKPAWQRLLVLFGGVFFNFILAIVIYTGVLAAWGEEYIKNSDVTTGMVVDDLAYEIGFRDGDRILTIEEQAPERFFDIQPDIIRMQARYARVLRGDDTVTVNIDEKYIPAILNNKGMFSFGIPYIIESVPDSSLNAGSGLAANDRILALNNESTEFMTHVVRYMQQHKGDSLIATIARGNELLYIPIATDSAGRMGVYIKHKITDFYNVTKVDYSFFEAIPAGFNKTITTVSNYWKELKLIFSPKTEAYKSVGSFITIGSIFPDTWNWEIFWNLTAFLSVMLAVLNVLPIPALDGGHILFTLYEIVTRRKPSDKFLEYAQTVGMLLLFAIMILAFGNDIFRLFN